MKRSSKIIAVLLTALLIAGVFATAIFASDLTTTSTNTPKLDFTDATAGVTSDSGGTTPTLANEDFTGANYSITHTNTITGSASTTNKDLVGTVFGGRKTGNFCTVDVKSGDTILNTYGRVWNDSTQNASSGNGGYLELGPTYSSSPVASSFILNDFVVMDMDLAADQYVYTVDDVQMLTSNINEIPEGTAYNLAYPTDVNFDPHYRTSAPSGGTAFWKSGTNVIKFYESNGIWNLKNNSTGEMIPLSQELGAWNHVTLIWQVDNRVDYTYTDADGEHTVTAGTYQDYLNLKDTDGSAIAETAKEVTKTYLGNTMLHMYVNGVKFSSATAISSGNTAAANAGMNKDANGTIMSTAYAMSPNEIRISAPTGTSSYAIDNIAYHYYKDGYAGELATAFADGNVPATLGEYDDIVYNYGYKYSAPNAEYAAAVTSNSTGEYKTAYYRTVAEAVANLGENDIISLADGVAAIIKTDFPFFMIRNVDKTVVVYADGYGETALTGGGYYVSFEDGDLTTAEGDGIKNIWHDDFQKYLDETKGYYVGVGTAEKGLNNLGQSFFGQQLIGSKSHAIMKSELNADKTNAYLKLWHSWSATDTFDTSKPHDVGTDIYYDASSSDKWVIGNRYVVLSFDMMSDEYLAYDSATGKFSFSETDTGRLAYSPNFSFGNLTYYINSSTAGVGNFGLAYDSAKKASYITFAGGKGYLSTVPGEWNRIQMVIAIDNDVVCTDSEGKELTCSYAEAVEKGYTIVSTHLNNTMVYGYVNGKLVGQKKFFNNTALSDPATAKTVYLFRQRTSGSGGSNYLTNAYSMGFDNGSVAYYSDDYTGALDLIYRDKDGNPITSVGSSTLASIVGSEVVGGADSLFPAPNTPVASIVFGNGEASATKNYSFMESALASLTENSALKLNGDTTLLNYVPSFVFDVICDEGEFTLADTVTDYVAVRTADGYLVRPASDYTIDVTLENGEATETLEITVNDKIAGKGAAFNGGLVSEGDAGATYQNLLTWTWKYYALDGTLTETESDVLTAEIINAILGNADNNNTATVTPKFENITVTAFAVLDETGALVTDADGGYTVYNDIANIVDAASNAPSGATVVMHADFNYYHTSGNGIVVAAGKTLRLDLNGHKIIHMMGEKRQLIYMLNSTNADFAIYSSKAGGEIASISCPAATAPALKYGYIVQAANADGAVVSFGAFDKDGDGVKEIPGNNLTIQTSLLVECTSNKESTAPVYVVMDGGTYVGTSDGWAFITARFDVAVDIKNITYWSASQAFIKGKTDYSYSGVTGTIDNSTIITSSLIYDTPNTSITVTNSLLCGTIAPYSGSVTLGAGVELGGTQSGLAYLDNCAKFDYAGNGEEREITVTYYAFVYTNGAADFEKSIKTTETKKFTVNAIVKDITKDVPDVVINWYDKDGNLLGTTNSYPGAKPSNIPNAPAYLEDGNKFYYLEESDKWLLDGEAVDPAELTSGTYDLHANMIVPVLDIDESLIMFNLTVANKFEKHVYVPHITGDFLYTSATYLLGGSATSTKEYNGVMYSTRIIGYPSAVNGVDTNSVTITAIIGGYKSTQTVRIPSIPTYIKTVLESNSFDYYTKKLCVNMARYCDEIYDYTREYQIATSGTSSLLATSPYNVYCTGDYAQYLIDTTTSAFNNQIAAEAKADVNNVLNYFDGATFYLGNTGIPRLAFVPKTLAEGETLPGDVKVIGVYYSYKGFKDPETGVAEEIKQALPLDVTGTQSNAVNTGLYMNINLNERIYFYANDLTITVYLKDAEGKESSVTGVYNLAGYIKGLENGGAATDTSLDVAKAMYAYSMAAIEYLTTEEGTAAPSTPEN